MKAAVSGVVELAQRRWGHRRVGLGAGPGAFSMPFSRMLLSVHQHCSILDPTVGVRHLPGTWCCSLVRPCCDVCSCPCRGAPPCSSPPHSRLPSLGASLLLPHNLHPGCPPCSPRPMALAVSSLRVAAGLGAVPVLPPHGDLPAVCTLCREAVEG